MTNGRSPMCLHKMVYFRPTCERVRVTCESERERCLRVHEQAREQLELSLTHSPAHSHLTAQKPPSMLDYNKASASCHQSVIGGF